MSQFKIALVSVLLTSLITGSTLADPAKLTIVDLKDRSMIITVVGPVGDDKVTIQRIKDRKQFTIPLDSLNEDSQKEVKKELKTISESYPELTSEVSISKRRKAENGSSYMKNMVISAKATVKIKKQNLTCPPCTASLIFIGQDQRTPDRYQVLSSQRFKFTPTAEGEILETKSFSTSYDSDNKGDGNIGGYKYKSYLLVVFDKDGKAILTKTLDSKIKKAIEGNMSFSKTMATYKKGTYLKDSMVAE